MSLTKITEADLVNKGVVGLPDTPGLSTSEMQEKLDEIALDVIVPKHNALVDELEDLDVEHKVGSDAITNIRTNADMAIEVSTDGGETYVGTASSGHRIEDGNGYIYPNRSRLQFSSNVTITDNPEGNATFLSVANGEKGDKGDAATIAIGTVQSGVAPAVTNTGSNTDAIFNFTFPKGDDGNAATVQVGTVTSGANASVTNRGTSSAAILDFTLPKGDQGDPGTGLTILASYATLADLQSAHPTGQRGDAYYIESNEHVYIWDIDNLAWEDIGAIKGAKGDTGSAATITVGTVTTGATASVVNSGTTSAAVLDFVLQKGDKGDTGNTGTIAVGTVTSGVTASVTNSGTSTAAVFDFVLPKGDKGDKGDPGNAILPHFRITSDHGSTVTITKGAIEIAAVETSSGIYEADVPEYGTYTVTSVYSGQTTTKTVDVDTVKVYTANVSIPTGTIIVTYPVGATCTCVGQGESYTATANPQTFTVYHTGTYVITVSKDGDTESENVVITTQGQTEYITIDLIPDGSTVTPTDDVQTWLKCAGIKDKTTYTTLSDVLADSVTFNALLGDSNANKYMARSTTWASTLCADQYAMTMIGQYDVCADALLGNSTWASAIAASAYVDSVLNVSVPTMTSNTSPSGECIGDVFINPLYYAFDKNTSTKWYSQYLSGATPDYAHIGYHFTSPVIVRAFSFVGNLDSPYLMPTKIQLQGSNDNSTWVDIGSEYNYATADANKHTEVVINSTAYEYYRVKCYPRAITDQYYAQLSELQFYGRADTTEKIHGANEEVAYYLDGATQVPISDPSTLDAGTYTFGSTIAKNPDSLATDYTKSIRITPNTVEVVLRPDKSLYWWGSVVSDFGSISTANGWSGSFTEPTWNSTNVRNTSSSFSYFSGVAKKTSIALSKICAVLKGETINPDNVYGYFVALKSKTVPSSDSVTSEAITSNAIHKKELTINYTGYPSVTVQNGSHTVYALWYE